MALNPTDAKSTLVQFWCRQATTASLDQNELSWEEITNSYVNYHIYMCVCDSKNDDNNNNGDNGNIMKW